MKQTFFHSFFSDTQHYYREIYDKPKILGVLNKLMKGKKKSTFSFHFSREILIKGKKNLSIFLACIFIGSNTALGVWFTGKTHSKAHSKSGSFLAGLSPLKATKNVINSNLYFHHPKLIDPEQSFQFPIYLTYNLSKTCYLGCNVVRHI